MSAPPLERILAATDGTSSGRLAVVRAASIARETGAALHAVHVTAPAEATTDDTLSSEPDEPDIDVARHLARIDPTPEIHRVHGAAFVEIIRLARVIDAGLVVTGAHGGPAARRFFLGTTAGRVARHGDRPLLLVRQAVRRPYRRVLVGVDASPESADAITTARALAPNATLVPAMVHHVIGEAKLRGVADDAAVAELRSRVAEDRRRELEEFLTTHVDSSGLVDIDPIVAIGNPKQRLCELLREHRCDLIAIGTHGRSRISYALLGSVAEQVLRDSERDVLLTRHGPTELQLP